MVTGQLYAYSWAHFFREPGPLHLMHILKDASSALQLQAPESSTTPSNSRLRGWSGHPFPLPQQHSASMMMSKKQQGT